MRISLAVTFSMIWSFSSCIEWNYIGTDEDHGPSGWPGICGTGSRQSPIEIPRTGLQKLEVDPLVFKNYQIAPKSMQVINNGHTVKVVPTAVSLSKQSGIYGGGLYRDYKLLQVHFHWGSAPKKGSEHVIGGTSYPLEAHFVHYAMSYETVQEALKDPAKNPDTLAVIGVMFVLDNVDNQNLTRLVESFKRVRDPESSSNVTSFPLDLLLPHDRSSFYRYNGSLTTPSCNEIVTWTVMKDVVPLSMEQLAEFTKLEDKDGLQMVNNFRPSQPVNDRPVYEAFINRSSKMTCGLTFTLAFLLIIINSISPNTQ